MLFQISDFTGEYRLDTNVITQADYTTAIRQHEEALIRTIFLETSVQKIYSVTLPAAPAQFVREALRDFAVMFIWHRIRMGVSGSLPGEPTTHGYRPRPINPALWSAQKIAIGKLRKYCPYELRISLAAASNTITITPADPNLPKLVSVGDVALVDASTLFTVTSVTPSQITLSASVPAGDHILRIDTLSLRTKSHFIAI